MQPGAGHPGGYAQLTPQQQQQLMMQMGQYPQMGMAHGMLQPQVMQQPYGTLSQQHVQQQYMMQQQAMVGMTGQAGAPGIAVNNIQSQSQQQPQQQQQQQPQPQQQHRASADGGDTDFDFDNIPSPGASPAGAGAGPSAAQQQQQQGLPYPQGQPVASRASAQMAQQPVQAHAPQQPPQIQQQQQHLVAQRQREADEAARQQAEQARLAEQAVQRRAAQPPLTVDQTKQLQAQLAHMQQGQQRPGAIGMPAAAAAGPGARPPGSATAALTAAQATLANADAVAAKTARRGPIVTQLPAYKPPGASSIQVGMAPGATNLAQGQQQQTQNAAASALAAAAEARKRKRADLPLLPPPEDAISLEQLISRAQLGGGGSRPLPGMPGAAAAAAGAGPGTDGPSVSVDEILKRPEYQKGTSSSSTAAKGKGRAGGRLEDESRVMPEAKVKRLLELQGLSKSFRMQPELQEQLTKLAEAFVTEAVEFGCSLAARRRGSTLRPADLALYMQRTHHLHVPGFSKEYTPYKRPVVNDAHRQRLIAVRKAQLHPQQQQQGGATGADAGAKVAGTVRFNE